MFRVLAVSAVALLVVVTGGLHHRLACAADTKAIEVFNGKDLSGWKPKDEKKSKWQVCAVSWDEKKPDALIGGINNSPDGKGSVLGTITGGGTDILTEQKFGDCTIEVEFMIPKGSNSGVYVMGEYEVQIYDTYGKANDKLGPGDMGGIYTYAAPKVNAMKKPGEWQKFVIEFVAPKFEGDKKVANGKFVKVTFNDQVIHENIELTKGPTPGGLTGKEAATGPLMFQGDHGAVAFRNIKVTPR